MEKILISACLLGENCRYDAKSSPFPLLSKLREKYELVPYCPEVECGLPIPRVPAEIKNGQVINKNGENLTKKYQMAAEGAVRLCKLLNISIAILKDGSPACGSRTIHDGKFSGNKIAGLGVTARALIQAGIKVYADIDELNFLVEDRDLTLPEREEERYGVIKSERAKQILLAREGKKSKKDSLPSSGKREKTSRREQSGHPSSFLRKKDSHSSSNKKDSSFSSHKKSESRKPYFDRNNRKKKSFGRGRFKKGRSSYSSKKRSA